MNRNAADARLDLATAWLREQGHARARFEPLTGDASFRRYFCVREGQFRAVLMDAPPEHEDTLPFVDVAQRLRAGGVHAPEIMAADTDAGFLLLEYLGDDLLRDVIHTNNADEWFPRLFDILQDMAGKVDAAGLPEYDRERLVRELELFPRWYLERHKGLELSCEDWDIWEELCTRLIGAAYEQPRVFVHRDFHSCNLLRLASGGVGVIDFQDAVRGPLTYDFVSLIWDRYIAWPRSRLEGWMEDFRTRVSAETPSTDWVRWCDWMGLQRNLKVVGIFARLKLRDGKDGYLEMIPRFWGYVMDALPRYPEFRAFQDLLERLRCAP